MPSLVLAAVSTAQGWAGGGRYGLEAAEDQELMEAGDEEDGEDMQAGAHIRGAHIGDGVAFGAVAFVPGVTGAGEDIGEDLSAVSLGLSVAAGQVDRGLEGEDLGLDADYL